MSYSKQDRDDAALICAIAASTERLWLYSEISELPRHGNGVSELHAEAEALIRSGWSPK